MRDNRTISDMGSMTLEQFSVSVNFFTSGDKMLINGDPFNYIIFHELENDYCLVNNSSSSDKYSIGVDDLFDLVTDNKIKEEESAEEEIRILKLESKVLDIVQDNKYIYSELKNKLDKITGLYYYSLPAILIINIIILVL